MLLDLNLPGPSNPRREPSGRVSAICRRVLPTDQQTVLAAIGAGPPVCSQVVYQPGDANALRLVLAGGTFETEFVASGGD